MTTKYIVNMILQTWSKWNRTRYEKRALLTIAEVKITEFDVDVTITSRLHASLSIFVT